MNKPTAHLDVASIRIFDLIVAMYRSSIPRQDTERAAFLAWKLSNEHYTNERADAVNEYILSIVQALPNWKGD